MSKTPDPAFVPARRHLLMLAAGGMAACTSGPPKVANKPPPERIALLPVQPYGEVGLYYSSTTKGVVGALTGGIGRLAMHASEKDLSRLFTERLAEQKLAASERLSNAVLSALLERGGRVESAPQAPRTATAIKEWKFQPLRADADAVLHLELNELAYSTWNESSVYPKICVTMYLISTVDEDPLGSASYYVRMDAVRTDRRDLPPLKRDRFDSSDALLADAARAAQSLTDGLNRIARVISADVVGLQRGEPMQWDG